MEATTLNNFFFQLDKLNWDYMTIIIHYWVPSMISQQRNNKFIFQQFILQSILSNILNSKKIRLFAEEKVSKPTQFTSHF